MTKRMKPDGLHAPDAGSDALLRDAFSQDAFFQELAELDTHAPAELGLSCVSEALDVEAPPAALRARLLADIPKQGRYERFAEAAANILDIGVDAARALLDKIDDPSVWSHELPGIAFFWVDGGPAVANAVRGFLRVDAGLDFPDHEHLGDEITLVMQGSYVDPGRGQVFRPGDIDRMSSGTSHTFHVPKDGPHLVKLAVTHNGLRALGTTFLPR
jgi:hypothetical protein